MTSGAGQSLRRGLLLVLSLLLLLGTANAQSDLPPDLIQRLDRGVAEARARNAEALESPAFSDLRPGNEHVASVAVINAAGNPSRAAAIVGYLSTRMPEARDQISRAVGGSFPGFATEIRAAAGTPPAPADPGFTQGTDTVGFWYSQPALDRFRSGPAGVAPNGPLPSVGAVSATRAGRERATDLPALVPVEEPWDPLQPMNLLFYSFNQAVDLVVLRPAAWLLDKAPDPVQTSIANAVHNYSEPIIFVNDILQGEFTQASLSVGRFALNTTLGLGGLFDVADMWFGWEPHNADFGQTLHRYGVPAGPYLVLPVLGPTNLRDAFGYAAAEAADPFALVTKVPGRIIHGTTEELSDRMIAFPVEEAIRNGEDHYERQRALYYQRRAVTLSRRTSRQTEGAALDADLSRPEFYRPEFDH
ncbi:MAG: VacJ family lipoprotein [Minwuia sp.]|nr:VacJ family lipoprotein [Minwuia sp.]